MPGESPIDVVELTRALVRLPSVNPMGRPFDARYCHETRVTKFLEDMFRSKGIQTERSAALLGTDQSPIRENLVAWVSGASERPSILLEAHQDTVPVDGMTIEPFAGDLRDDRIYGRGACDIKGGMASMISAFLAVARLSEDRRPNLTVAFTVNEEHGFCGAKQLRKDMESGTCPAFRRSPDLIIVSEPTELNVVVAHKGVVRWRCRTRGRAGHSSDPRHADNAIFAMAKVLQRLNCYAETVVGSLADHPLVGPPTLSVGTITGGMSVNTIPESCEIHIDRRLCPQEDDRQARRHVMDDLRVHVSGVTLEHDAPDILSPGLDCKSNTGLADALVHTVHACGYDSKPIGVRYGTDAAILSATGIPTVVFGPGSIDQAHTGDEWIAISQLRAAERCLFDFLKTDRLE